MGGNRGGPVDKPKDVAAALKRAIAKVKSRDAGAARHHHGQNAENRDRTTFPQRHKSEAGKRGLSP